MRSSKVMFGVGLLIAICFLSTFCPGAEKPVTELTLPMGRLLKMELDKDSKADDETISGTLVEDLFFDKKKVFGAGKVKATGTMDNGKRTKWLLVVEKENGSFSIEIKADPLVRSDDATRHGSVFSGEGKKGTPFYLFTESEIVIPSDEKEGGQ